MIMMIKQNASSYQIGALTAPFEERVNECICCCQAFCKTHNLNVSLGVRPVWQISTPEESYIEQRIGYVLLLRKTLGQLKNALVACIKSPVAPSSDSDERKWHRCEAKLLSTI